MKFKNHIFFMLGIASIFSLGQTNGAFGYSNCSISAGKGYYCKTSGSKPACPKGCYCKGGKNHTNGIDVENKCALRNWTDADTQILNAAGIHLCPWGKPDSDKYSKTEEDCYKYSYCTNVAGKGKYCRRRNYAKEDCKPGCYCVGGSEAVGGESPADQYWRQVTSRCSDHMDAVIPNSSGETVQDFLNERGIYYCPDGFSKSYAKAEKIEDCYETYNGRDIYYKKYTCAKGYYLPKQDSLCKPCKSGSYYCTGITDEYPSATEDQGLYFCDGTLIMDGNIAVDCEHSSNNSQLVSPVLKPYNGGLLQIVCNEDKVSCVAGSYLPAGGDSTHDCELCEPGFYCLAGCHTPNSNKDQTPKKCPVSKPNSVAGSGSVNDCYASGTTPSNIQCGAGYYLPSGADSEDDCEWCEAGYMCPGNNLKYKCGPRGYSEGGASQCSTCPDGQMADNANKSCEDGLIEVQAGYYLRANTIIPEPCPSANKFCPGGRWKKYSEDQGAFKCPFDSRLAGEVSSDHQSCIIKLTPDQMVYGVDASRDGCLGYTNATNYQQCVWGDISFEVVNDTGIVYNENGDVNNPNASSSSSWNQNSSNTTNTFVQNDDAAASKRKQVDDTTFAEKDVANKYDVQYIPKEPLKTEKVTGSSTQPTQLMNVTKVSGSNSTVATVPVAARSARAPRTTRVKQPQRGVVKR